MSTISYRIKNTKTLLQMHINVKNLAKNRRSNPPFGKFTGKMPNSDSLVGFSAKFLHRYVQSLAQGVERRYARCICAMGCACGAKSLWAEMKYWHTILCHMGSPVGNLQRCALRCGRML